MSSKMLKTLHLLNDPRLSNEKREEYRSYLASKSSRSEEAFLELIGYAEHGEHAIQGQAWSALLNMELPLRRCLRITDHVNFQVRHFSYQKIRELLLRRQKPLAGRFVKEILTTLEKGFTDPVPIVREGASELLSTMALLDYKVASLIPKLRALTAAEQKRAPRPWIAELTALERALAFATSTTHRVITVE